jgi:hypothetical protein
MIPRWAATAGCAEFGILDAHFQKNLRQGRQKNCFEHPCQVLAKARYRIFEKLGIRASFAGVNRGIVYTLYLRKRPKCTV